MIYSEQEFCLWCTCNAPRTHYCRSSLMQYVRHCEHRAVRSQKCFRPKKPVRFCAPSAGSGRAGSPPGWSAAGSPLSPFPPQSPLSRQRWVFAERTWCFPESARAAAQRGREPGVNVGKAGNCAASSYCPPVRLRAHLERVAEASQV